MEGKILAVLTFTIQEENISRKKTGLNREPAGRKRGAGFQSMHLVTSHTDTLNGRGR
jgi:hypothetical protein